MEITTGLHTILVMENIAYFALYNSSDILAGEKRYIANNYETNIMVNSKSSLVILSKNPQYCRSHLCQKNTNTTQCFKKQI